MSDRSVDISCLGSMHATEKSRAAKAWKLSIEQHCMCTACQHSCQLLGMFPQAIFEEMQAVGLHKPGGFMRQAFSLGDLTLLQPPNEVQDAMTRTWSPSTSDAQAALYSHSELPELLSLPAYSPQQAL